METVDPAATTAPSPMVRIFPDEQTMVLPTPMTAPLPDDDPPCTLGVTDDRAAHRDRCVFTNLQRFGMSSIEEDVISNPYAAFDLHPAQAMQKRS